MQAGPQGAGRALAGRASVGAAGARGAGREHASSRRLGVLAGSVGPVWCTMHLAQF